MTLWQYSSGMSDRNARKLLKTLSNKGFIRVDQVTGAGKGELKERVSLHDLIKEYLMTKTNDITSIHRDLIQAYSKITPDGWVFGPDDGYFLQHITGHLIAAGKQKEAEELLLDPRWLKRKIELGMIRELIEEYDPIAKDNRPLLLVQGAIRLSSHILSQDPTQFGTQMFGRLLECDEPRIQKFLDWVKEEQKKPWLRPVKQYFAAPGGPLIQTLGGHTGSVNSVAISTDGLKAVSGSDDKTVRIWDLVTRVCTGVITDHTDSVKSVALSPDGKTVVSGSADNTIRVWDLITGECTAVLEGHTDSVNSVAFFPDGKTVVSGSNDYTVRVWDSVTKRCTAVLKGHTDSVKSVAVSSNDRIIVSGSYDTTVRVWDIATEECTVVLQGHTGLVYSVAFFPDGKTVVSGSDDKTVRVWDLGTG
ncbi:MAG: hypothetical protein JXA44_08640, partial [Methanospirillaceae archaeon]|nr:hypothetical protein [Methanospirillaceae archaeon]